MKIKVSVINVFLLLAGLVWAAPQGTHAQGSQGGMLAGSGAGAAPLTTQDFQDVPTNSTFYTYVHNLFVDGVVGGYACGGSGEPCVPPGNLPYFRPGANVTRGQNAKFTDNGRRVLTGAHSQPAGPDYGLFSALNTDYSISDNAGLYGSGATGVWGDSQTSGTASGYGGYFVNNGGGTGEQFGAIGLTNNGWGLEGVSYGATGKQASAGLVGISTDSGGAGGVFTGSVGLVADGARAGVVGLSTVSGGVGGVFTATNSLGSAGLIAVGHSGASLAGDGATPILSNDGLDVSGAGGSSDGIYVQQPSGDANFSLYGYAHVHGSNIASDDYESEVVYDGAAPLALGRVVALDPANTMGGPLGVVPADATNVDAAIGVISYRLITVTVNGVAKTVIDSQATAVKPGDRAYITILGRVAMTLPPGSTVGTRLAVGAGGEAVVAADPSASFGRVASEPDATGRGEVLVNFK